jgi:hypothetical protein
VKKFRYRSNPLLDLVIKSKTSYLAIESSQFHVVELRSRRNISISVTILPQVNAAGDGKVPQPEQRQRRFKTYSNYAELPSSSFKRVKSLNRGVRRDFVLCSPRTPRFRVRQRSPCNFPQPLRRPVFRYLDAPDELAPAASPTIRSSNFFP